MTVCPWCGYPVETRERTKVCTHCSASFAMHKSGKIYWRELRQDDAAARAFFDTFAR